MHWALCVDIILKTLRTVLKIGFGITGIVCAGLRY